MEYRQVGNTDMVISEIGFGTGGAAGLMVRGSHEEQLRIIDRAIELGINYFDESPDYGYPGVSEINLGKVLKELQVVQEIVVLKELKVQQDRKELKVQQDLLVLYVTLFTST